jgi:uncharacterized protein (TIRG00374 family)
MKKILLRGLISFAFVVLLVYLMREDIPKVYHTLQNMDRLLVTASVLIFFSTVWLMARRLQLVFEVKELPLSLAEAANLTLVGYFFNNFLPTSVGGDIVKAMCAARITKNTLKSVAGVLMDRIFGLFAFIVIPSITLLFFIKKIGSPLVPFMMYSLLGVTGCCFFLIFNRTVARRFRFIEFFLSRFGMDQKARAIYENLHDFKNHKRVVVAVLALSVAAQSVGILVLYMMSLALGSRAPMIYFFLLVPVVHFVSMLPSLNGLGIREGAYIYFLSPYIGREYSAALGILWLGLLFLLSLLGGVIYFIRHDYHIRFKQAVMPIDPEDALRTECVK